MRIETLFSLAFLFMSVYSDNDQCTDVKCPSVPKHYEEFGCNPVVEAGKCCPSHFDCSSFINRDSSKCFYNNQVFNISGNLDSPDITSSCTAGCRCVEADEYHPKANFLCTHIDCPEFFGESMETSGEECIAQHQLNSCCSTGSVCGEKIKELERCDVNGNIYYEGQQIDTAHSCFSCICGKDYEDKPFKENKHCRKINCNMELHYSTNLLKGCIPVYFKSDDCCPIDWRCPSEDTKVIIDTVVNNINGTNDSHEEKCTFGDLTMNVGESLSPWANDYDNCTTCKCTIPPYAHCVKTC